MPLPCGTNLQTCAHQCEHARTRRGGRPCPPGRMHLQKRMHHRRIRKMFVGVDAALSPHTARPFLRNATANLRLPDGRTEASAPTGRFTFSPKMRAILRLHTAGSMWASTPTNALRGRRSLRGFVSAFCRAGQAPPLRCDEQRKPYQLTNSDVRATMTARAKAPGRVSHHTAGGCGFIS